VAFFQRCFEWYHQHLWSQGTCVGVSSSSMSC
jgi:hypothetical protein